MSWGPVSSLWVPDEQGLDSGLRDRALLLVGFAVALRQTYRPQCERRATRTA